MRNKDKMNNYNAVTISVIKTSNYPLLPAPTAEYKPYFSLPTIGDYNLISIKNCDVGAGKQLLFDVLNNFSQQSLNNNHSDIVSKHTFYAIKNNLTNNSFFEGENKNFTFVSMIHFNYRRMIKDNKTRDQIIRDIYLSITVESESTQLNKNDLVIYDSLDSFEIVLIFRIDDYREGANLIKNIDAMDYVIYSYSLFGYDKQRINMIQEIADKITICAVVNNQKAFENWLDTLRQHCKRFTDKKNFFQYNRMGNEDIIINIKDYPIDDFLKQLDINGIFAEKNFKKAFMNLRIHFDDKYNMMGNKKEFSDLEENSFKEKYLNAVDQNKSVNVRPEINAAIVEVLNSCDKLFSQYFADDVYVCLWNVFDEFIKRVATFRGENRNERGEPTSLVMYNESINRFKNSIMSIITGSLHSDRMFFQSPGFNAVLYNIPSKLIVFYTAFVNKIANALKTGNENFSFIISPDLYLNTSVSKLFDEEGTNPLCKIRTSVNSLFSPQSLLTSLTHEVAHFVGSETRMRKERLGYEIRIIASKFTNRILKEVKDGTYKKIMLLMHKTELDKVKLDVYNAAYKIIVEKITNSINMQINYKNIYNRNDLVYYQKSTKEMLIKAVFSVFDDTDDLPFTLINRLKIERNDELEIFSFMDLQFELTKIILNSARQASNLTKNTVTRIHFLMKESYADLVMTYMLDLSMDEYLATFNYIEVDRKPETEEEMIGFLHNQLLIERMISVCKANNWNINNVGGNGIYYKIIRKFYNGELSLQLDMAYIDINVDYLSKCLNKLNQTIDKEELVNISKLFSVLKQDEIGRAVDIIYSNVNELRKLQK